MVHSKEKLLLFLAAFSASTGLASGLARYNKAPPANAATLMISAINRHKREEVDLHSGEFCVDVSTYGDITFSSEPREQCDTEFVKRCEQKNEQVCDEVTEMQCDIIPYTECKMTMEATPYKSYEMIPKTYAKKVCTEGMDTVQHTKMMPECRNVTKQNCITKWETDENGNQVWAGNEACEPVTWRECKLVPRQVDFKVPKIDCQDGEEIPYTDTQEAEKTQMTTAMTCDVKHTTSCKPVVSTKCQTITFQECQEEPIEQCSQVDMQVPKQEKEHKKKCLLPDDGSFANGNNGNSGVAPRSGKAASIAVQGRASKRPLAQEQDNKIITASPPQPLPLDRLGSASTRHTRRFNHQGFVGAPQVFQRQQQQQLQQGGQRRVHQGQFVKGINNQ